MVAVRLDCAEREVSASLITTDVADKSDIADKATLGVTIRTASAVRLLVPIMILAPFSIRMAVEDKSDWTLSAEPAWAISVPEAVTEL
jgi:hypothetical protein